MKKVFLIVLLIAISASYSFAQRQILSAANTSGLTDSFVNKLDTAQYFPLGRINSGGFTIQANHTKVSGFVKGYGYLEQSSDGETSANKRWIPVVGDSITLANDNNTHFISVSAPVPGRDYRYTFIAIDSTQTNSIKVWFTPKPQ